MGMINLMSLEPHKVSRDLSGYITYFFGPPKNILGTIRVIGWLNSSKKLGS